jgi:hypothetical protein
MFHVSPKPRGRQDHYPAGRNKTPDPGNCSPWRVEFLLFTPRLSSLLGLLASLSPLSAGASPLSARDVLPSPPSLPSAVLLCSSLSPSLSLSLSVYLSLWSFPASHNLPCQRYCLDLTPEERLSVAKGTIDEWYQEWQASCESFGERHDILEVLYGIAKVDHNRHNKSFSIPISLLLKPFCHQLPYPSSHSNRPITVRLMSPTLFGAVIITNILSLTSLYSLSSLYPVLVVLTVLTVLDVLTVLTVLTVLAVLAALTALTVLNVLNVLTVLMYSLYSHIAIRSVWFSSTKTHSRINRKRG